MTWLFEKTTAPGSMPMDLLAEGLFGSRTREAILPLEFGPAFPVAIPAEEYVPEPAVENAEAVEARERARQVRVMVDAAREEAAAEARESLEAECAAKIEAERGRVHSVLALFAEERARWFRRAEGELVELALAIARRVLDREMKTDPLALREIAQAAVSRVQDESGVVLRVAPARVADWRGAFSSRPDLEVMGDATVAEGDVVVDTTFGRVELGIGMQLGEVAERLGEMVGGPRRILVRDQGK